MNDDISKQFEGIIGKSYSPREQAEHKTHAMLHESHAGVLEVHDTLEDRRKKGVDVPDEHIAEAVRIFRLFHHGVEKARRTGLVTPKYPSGVDCNMCGQHLRTPWLLDLSDS